MNGLPGRPQRRQTRQSQPVFCALVMPISAMGGDYTQEHWANVREMIADALRRTVPPFEVRIASETDVAGSIHATIATSLRDAPIVVCDVSGRNANAIYELGFRNGQGKPIVIVKDDKTDYITDLRDFVYIEYKLNGGYLAIKRFQEQLAATVVATYLASQKGRNERSRVKVAQPRVVQPISLAPGAAPAPPPVNSDVQRQLEDLGYRLGRLEQSLRPADSAASSEFLIQEVVGYVEREHVDDPRTLVGDDAFWQHMFNQRPLRYFRNATEFRQTTRMLLNSLMPAATSH